MATERPLTAATRPPRQCGECGQSFSSRHNGKRYCSTTCRENGERRLNREGIWRRRGIDDRKTHPCAICGRSGVRLVMDHDHGTGKRRGFLCNECNAGLGFFEDDRARLRAAIRYLLQHEMNDTDAG